jgi:hypothetical protein
VEGRGKKEEGRSKKAEVKGYRVEVRGKKVTCNKCQLGRTKKHEAA